MSINLKAKLIASLAVAGAFAFAILYGQAFADAALRFVNEPTGYSVYHTFLSATTTSATSTNSAFGEEQRLKIAGAKKVTFFVSRAYGGGNAGASKFEVEVSPDGTNWFDFNHLIQNDVSGTATSSLTISAATSSLVASMDLDYENYLYARCVVQEVTDGTHTCKALAEY